MTETKKRLPNILTVLRILLAIGCTYFAVKGDQYSLTISLIIFLVASFTDFLDGYLARLWKTESNFGRITDPIADKLLILGVLFSFAMQDVVPFLFAVGGLEQRVASHSFLTPADSFYFSWCSTNRSGAPRILLQ